MKKLLLVSDPPASPGYLPRLRYLCDFLVRKGYEITLLTEEYQPLTFTHDYPIQTIRMYSGSTIDWLLKTIWTLLTNWHNRVFAKKYLSCHKTEHFDLVLCSAFSDFPLGAALQIAQTWKVPLICDIRDLDEQVDDSRYQYKHQSKWLMPFRRLYRTIHICRRNKVLRAANAITTVSPWHVNFIKQFNPNVHLIYNGYDEAQFYPQDIKTDRFTVSYIGSLFGWQKPALKKVQQAIEELNKQQASNIYLDIHMPQCKPIVYNELGDAIRRSSMMLVFTSSATHGMMTTKFFEAVGCAKPVLCVPSDKGCLADTIKATNAGIATEDMIEIKTFILSKYQEWLSNGFTRQNIIHREDFSRAAQSAQIEQLLRKL